MRAKLINEIKFERTGNAKTSLGIGKAKEALDILEDSLNGTQRRYKYYDIEVKSLDDIRVRYSEDLGRRLDPGEKEFEWILKYHPIDQFEIKDYQDESVYFNQSIKTNKWLIQKNLFYVGSDPGRMEIKKETICSLEKETKNSREYAEVMTKALNDQYGKLWVFETLERKEISQ
jgi:hypothetical protein